MRLHSPIPQPCWCLAPVLPKQNGLPHNDWNATAHVILRQMARQRRRARLVQFDRRHSSALKQHSAGSLPLSSFRESHKASETTHMASESHKLGSTLGGVASGQLETCRLSSRPLPTVRRRKGQLLQKKWDVQARTAYGSCVV